LEQRLYPGDVLLGVWALTLGGQHLNSFSPNELAGALRAGDGSSSFDASGAAADALSPLSFLDEVPAAGQRPASVGDRTATASTFRSAGVFDGPLFAEATSAQSTIALPISRAAPALWTAIPAGMGGAWSDASASFFALAAAGNGELAGGPAGFLAAAHGSSGPLAFDASSGQLAIREEGGAHTVRESITTDGFVNVMLDGQEHSSNPRSASFDRALAGATGATVAGIRFAGGSQDTLTLGSQQVAGGLTVQATGGTVVTENVAATGSLAIQAPNITVNGAVQGSSVSLAASSWVTVNAAGRIDTSSGRAGGVNAPSTIAVAADVFVNSGQLHADGPAGGSITVQARNILNAGPITADSTGAGVPAGQAGIAFTGAYVATTTAVMSASSATGPGGQLTIDGGGTGRLYSSGRQLATGSVGGLVDLLGQDIILSAATVDASGQAGGGMVLIGGDFQGRDLALGNADTVTVTPASTIRADALRSGGGGRVSVRANQATEFDGSVSARGGPAGGSGGFIDLSGRGNLNYGGSADAGAPRGNSGTLLLDPKNIAISDAPAGIFPQVNLINPHGGGTFGAFFGLGVLVLSNGNVVVTDISDDFGGTNAGAAYLFDGLSGALISMLVGSHPQDSVGHSVTPLSNGNYVVNSPVWNGNRGAVTWGNGSTGTSGTISADNSLVGSNPQDDVGGGLVTPLSNGNYVVDSPQWNGGRGAATWGNGNTGTSGTISDADSLVGSNPGDYVGAKVTYDGQFPNFIFLVTALSNGNYVVESPQWNGGRGAATWGNGNTGISGSISADNSLVGSNPGDQVGQNLTALSNGNYVVASPLWNSQRGAVTWGNGSTGISGTISDSNSLVGMAANSVTALANGNYVISSRNAATWENGGMPVNGTITISAANSLVGTGTNSITPLSNGNYVVASSSWNGGRGAATWGNGSTGISGTISADNSLVGSNPGDSVGSIDLYGDVYLPPLSNGNYVVASPLWNGQRGAVTWGNGSTGTSGTISDANSLVGSNPGDYVGGHYQGRGGVTPLSNGNYVVPSPDWSGLLNGRGAVTWGNGNTGISGTVSAANSLVGNPGDQVGYFGVLPLNNGNYVVSSPNWNGGRGAATWENGTTGVSGTVSDANSLVGSNSGDYVGGLYVLSITPLSNGNYVVASSRGVTWASGTSGRTLDGLDTISPQNTLLGVGIGGGFPSVSDDPADQSFVAAINKRITVGLPDPNLFSYARGQAQSVTVTPQFLTNTLNSGTAVVLQASNDITVNSPIIVSAGGSGGALTLQAGRSIVLNANITTDNGALTLIANDELANGVVDAERDPGNAVITMASGTTLDTGSGTLTAELSDGAGLTNSTSGAITLQTLTAGSVSVINNGPSTGSDLDIGPVTTSGPQSYSNPNGTTNVTGNLTATDNSITFTDAVAVSDGVTVDAGASMVNFASNGTQTLQSGNGTSFDNVNHTGSGTLQLTSGLTVTGSFTNSAGTFDANDQPVTISGPATLAGGTYLAGMAPQTFSSGLSITGGSFTSSTGPMMVTGGISLSSGQLSGVGTIDVLTAIGGTVAPGGNSPGVLTISGAVAFNPSSTFSILVNGTNAGTDYSQLQAGGPIGLGQSTLSLNLGFTPPVGSSFEILTNTGATPIPDTFAGLAEGAIFSQGSSQFQITYQGGTGGDSIVLTCLA
jgi:hypothetical protein